MSAVKETEEETWQTATKTSRSKANLNDDLQEEELAVPYACVVDLETLQDVIATKVYEAGTRSTHAHCAQRYVA